MAHTCRADENEATNSVSLTDQTVMILEAMKAHSVNGDEGLVFPGIKTPDEAYGMMLPALAASYHMQGFHL